MCDRQPAASLASHVAAPARRELVSFHTAEHIRDEIRRIDSSVHHHCLVSCLNVSLQITENCLYANTKKTDKLKWKQHVRQLDSLSKLRRDIDSMSCA